MLVPVMSRLTCARDASQVCTPSVSSRALYVMEVNRETVKFCTDPSET